MRSILLAVTVSAAVAIGASACGSSSTAEPTKPPPVTVDEGGTDAAPPPDAAPPVDNGAPSTVYPAAHPPLPELVNQAGGKVLATPKAYLIFFPGYEHKTVIETLTKAVGATPYWASTTSEYGIGPLAYTDTIELTETAPAAITDKEIEAFINGKIASGAFGVPDPNVIYTIFYPKSTSITLAGGGPLGPSKSCSSFGGYHSNTGVVLNGAAKKNFAFAVLPTCAAFAGQTEIDGLTGALSHELIEAVTDPFPSTNAGQDSAYSSVDQDHFIWIVLGGGGENGDLCVSEPNAFYKPQGLDFTVQRTWSNKLAKAGHDPCAPNIAGPAYFNSAPVLKETVTLDLSLLGGGSTETKGVKIPVGKSAVIEVDLFSDAATSGPWSVTATDTVAQLTKQAPTLDFAWDRTKGLNGEKLHLTVTVKTAASLVAGAHPFSITSTLGQTKVSWPGLIVDQ